MDQTTCRLIPEFVLICGAVGSGNTFLFNCLTQNENVYGVNEDAFGSTLNRLIESERTMGKCPHAIDAFLGFLEALRGDRPTLILKNPSNLRYAGILREHLPAPCFIMVIRQPHAAITSGIGKHAEGTPIETIARTWLRDSRFLAELGDDSMLVTFEELVRDPEAVMHRISGQVLPLSESVFTYARRMHDPQRADGDRWKTKVDKETQRQIEHWVEVLDLEKAYDTITSTATHEEGGASKDGAANDTWWLWRPLAEARRQFFRGWYRLRR